MNIRNCIEMIEFGLNWKDTPNKKFSFEHANVCGTQCCFAGWFAIHKGFTRGSALTACADYLDVNNNLKNYFFINSEKCVPDYIDWSGPIDFDRYFESEEGMHNLAKHMRSWLEKETGKSYAELKAEYWIETGSWNDLKDIWIPSTEQTIEAEYNAIPEVKE